MANTVFLSPTDNMTEIIMNNVKHYFLLKPMEIYFTDDGTMQSKQKYNIYYLR